MASHFVSALNISCLRCTQKRIHVAIDEAADMDTGSDNGDGLEDEENLDVDTNMEGEASEDDEDALREASVTNFDAGNVVGKLITKDLLLILMQVMLLILMQVMSSGSLWLSLRSFAYVVRVRRTILQN